MKPQSCPSCFGGFIELAYTREICKECDGLGKILGWDQIDSYFRDWVKEFEKLKGCVNGKEESDKISYVSTYYGTNYISWPYYEISKDGDLRSIANKYFPHTTPLLLIYSGQQCPKIVSKPVIFELNIKYRAHLISNFLKFYKDVKHNLFYQMCGLHLVSDVEDRTFFNG